jgi:cob(I)alamin adenosyltransferase
MKIYTGSGDRGKTSLFSGERVAKDNQRVEAYGELDELNSTIGALIAALPSQAEEVRLELAKIQADLFHIGAWVATSPGAAAADSLPPIDPDLATCLEGSIDRMDATLAPLTGFILPGGSPSAAWAHIARTVCRRAERRVVRLSADINDVEAAEQARRAVVSLNRLSDYFFVLARYLNRIQAIEDVLWKR